MRTIVFPLCKLFRVASTDHFVMTETFFFPYSSGRECYLNGLGQPWKFARANQTNFWRKGAWQYNWYLKLSYPIPDPIAAAKATNSKKTGYSMCHYLSESSEEDGMRAYVEIAFKTNMYKQLINNVAWSVAVPYFRNRTMALCYEDFVADVNGNFNLTAASRSVDRVLEFFRAESTISRQERLERLRTLVGGSVTSEQHSTSHETNLRSRLRQIVFDLDRRYYGGDIAFLDAIWPCRRR